MQPGTPPLTDTAEQTATEGQPSRLYRVMWEIEVEADDPAGAAIAARDAFATDTSRGTIHVAQYLNDEYSGWGPVTEVPAPFAGPHPGVPEVDPTSFKP